MTVKKASKKTYEDIYICILTDLLIRGISGSTPLIHWNIEKIKIDNVNINTIEPNSTKGKIRRR